MREAILAAALSGHIEELRVPLDWNEMKPDVTPNINDDPIAYWKKISGDGEGREVLAALANMLQMRHASVPLGKDPENNLIYVWPYLAEAKLDALTPCRGGRFVAPRQPRSRQIDAREEEVDVVAADHRRGRHLAFVPKGE